MDQQQILDGIVHTLTDAASGTQQTASLQRLEHHAKDPQFPAYVSIILNSPTYPSHVRQIAGLTLKTSLQSSFAAIPADVVSYLKDNAFQSIADPDKSVRLTAASVCDFLIRAIGIQNWLQAFNHIVELVSSGDPLKEEGGIRTLRNIATSTNITPEIETYFIPLLVAFLGDQNERLRIDSLAILITFVHRVSEKNTSSPLYERRLPFREAVFSMFKDSSDRVKALVPEALREMLVSWPAIFGEEQVKAMMGFIEECASRGFDNEVALQAGELLLALSEEPEMAEHLDPLLPRIVAILLQGLIYSEHDAALAAQDSGPGGRDDATIPDKHEHVRPGTGQGFTSNKSTAITPAAKSLAARMGIDINNVPPPEADDDDDDDDDDEAGEDDDEPWTFRRCCEETLNSFAMTFESWFFEVSMPVLQTMFSNTNDWKIREAGITALGWMYEGCSSAFAPQMPHILPFLWSALSDEKPLVRSAAAETLGYMAAYCILPDSHSTYLQPSMQGLLSLVSDRSKMVQASAWSGITSFAQAATGTAAIDPYFNDIFSAFVAAMHSYQLKNRMTVYGSMTVVLELLGSSDAKIEQTKLQEAFSALVGRWDCTTKYDLEFPALMECVTAICAASKSQLTPFAQAIAERNVRSLHESLHEYEQYQAAMAGTASKEARAELEVPDTQHLMQALDLLSGLCRGLDKNAESILTGGHPSAAAMVVACLGYPDPQVLTTVLALLGDIASSSLLHIFRPQFPQLISSISTSIDPKATIRKSDLSSNACWCIGELALAEKQHLTEYVNSIPALIAPIVTSYKAKASLSQNACIAFGRLGFSTPQSLVAKLDGCFPMWCQTLHSVAAGAEKDTALQGMCIALQSSSQAMQTHGPTMLQLLGTYEQASPELQQTAAPLIRALTG